MWAGLWLTMSLPGQRPPTSPVVSAEDARTLNEALAAVDRNEGASARPVLERMAARYPRNFAANEAAGIVVLEAGEALQASFYLRRAALSRPDDAAAQANLGAAYLAADRPQEAIGPLRRATALDPGNAQTRGTLGRALYRAHRTPEAEAAFAEAARLDPANGQVLYNWAVALFDLDRDAAVVEALARIAAAERTDAVESLWGDAEERLGHFEQALHHLQTAAGLNPSEPAVYAVTIELLRHWSWEPAAQMAESGMMRYPESRRLRLARGIAAYGAGQYAAAAGIFGGLLTLEPENEHYGLLLGRSCAATGGSGAPECGSLVTFAEAHPGNAQIEVSAAVSLLHGDQPEAHLERAERLLRRALADDPKTADGYYQLGVLQQQRLQWAESAASLARAVELRPAFSEAHYRLSRAYGHLGDVAAAKREIALQQQYSQQEKDDSRKRLQEVTTFLIASH